MLLGAHQRNKNGEANGCFTLMEVRRLRSGQTAQRRLRYPGEINGSPRGAWRNTWSDTCFGRWQIGMRI
jgi:hypothetical protein